jgi:hypothetical protein
MTARLRKPTERVCERCDREEEWDEEAGTWRVRRVDGDLRVGAPRCLHEWDIDGTFAPFGEG